MKRILNMTMAAFALIALAAGQGAHAAERRLALVVGQAAYPAKPIATAANDAGLIAQTLQAAGFDVTGARDLEEAALRQTFRDFLDKAAAAGPDAVVFVYVSGYGLQLEGENYIVPVDAKLARDADLPLRALRVSDYLKPLAASGAKLSIVALDAARANPFQLAGQPLAGGLALFEPGGRTLLAFNAAPGTIAPEASGDYGPYAHALAEMIRDGGLPLMEIFDNTRLRVSEMTKGAQIPWNSQPIVTDFVFFQREANAPRRVDEAARLAQPISALGPDDGFSAALRRDTLQGYEDYVATYPAAPYAKRARAILAARREALSWRRSRMLDTPNAYWTYLKRYPRGPHAWDARRRLAEMRDALEPPPSFEMIDYGWPAPPPDELVYVEQPVVYFADPVWAFPPPPPPPVWFLPPPPPDFVILPPPVVIATPYVLPAPPYVPIPVWQAPPADIAPPPQNFIYANMHRAVALEPQADAVIIRDPLGGAVSKETLAPVGAGAAAVGLGAALPAALIQREPALRPVAPVAAPAPGAAPPVVAAPTTAPAPAEVRPGPIGETRPAAPPSGAAPRPVPAGPTALPGAPGVASPSVPPQPALAPQRPMPRPALPGMGADHAAPRPNEAAPGVARPARPDRGGDHMQPAPGAGLAIPTTRPVPGLDHRPNLPGAAAPGPAQRPAPSPIEGPSRDRLHGGPAGNGLAPDAPPVGDVYRGPRPTPGGEFGPDSRPILRGPAPSRHEGTQPRFEGGPADPMRGHGRGDMNEPPMGAPPRGLPPQMRDSIGASPEPVAPHAPPRGADAPGLPPHMRGAPRDLMPGGPPPVPPAPHDPGPGAGAPPQMRQMTPPATPAPPPPGAMRLPAPMPQRADPRRSEEAPRRGWGGDQGFGAPPGSGGR